MKDFKEVRGKVKDFLKKNGMDYERIDIKKEAETFIEDMNMGLAGVPGYMDMLPTYIPMNDVIPSNEPVIVMDAGGTNFRVATVYFDDKKNPVINDFSKYSMPAMMEEISKEEFLETIVEYLRPVIDKSDKIGFCFSYPITILPNGDGKPLRFSKEIKLDSLIGESIGALILEALKETGYTEEKKIVLLNDTVSTLLGGKATYDHRNFDSYVGFILGTGTNTCYIERGSNISKLKDLSSEYETMLINMESGGYSRAPYGKMDKEFDLLTKNPGEALFEKKFSGAYLGGLCEVVLKHAVEEKGLFSDSFRELFLQMEEIITLDVNYFMRWPYGDNPFAKLCDKTDHNDRVTLYQLFDCLIERAAKLTAINLIGVILKINKGHDISRPVCITADGSTFYLLKNFKRKLEYYMEEHLIKDLNLYYEFVEAENVNLTGAAIAALAKLK